MTTNNTYTPYRDMQAKLEQLQAFQGRSTTALPQGVPHLTIVITA